ncbi:hypothetical protein ABVT39_005284 [Epinephelus coioides]
MKACLDPPGNMLANRALVKLSGPIIRLVDKHDYRNIHGKHSARFGSGRCLPADKNDAGQLKPEGHCSADPPYYNQTQHKDWLLEH